MHVYPQFSYWISITLVKICFFRIVSKPHKNTFELVDTVLKMESLTCVIQLVKDTCYMGSIDLTDAYYSVPMATEHRKYLTFAWKTHFTNTRLPNGLASAPRCFTELLKPLYSTLQSKGFLNVEYTDDGY